MGYLISDKEFTVIYDPPIGKRTFQIGVNRDVTPEMADHWYAKAAGSRYTDKLEDAHKQAPEVRQRVTAMRAEWEIAQRNAATALITAEQLHQDLLKLEKETGVDSKALDKAFRESLKDEEERYQALMSTAQKADDEQKRQDAATSPSPAETERRAAGSEEVANTQMDGPAKADAEATAAANVPAPGQPALPPQPAPDPGPSPETIAAAGSAESANTKPSGEPSDKPKVDTNEEAAVKADAKPAADPKKPEPAKK